MHRWRVRPGRCHVSGGAAARRGGAGALGVLELRLLEAIDSSGRRIANAISRDARYRFSHDRVADAARDGLSEDAKHQTHLRIARWLVQQEDDRLFEAARHVGIGGRGLADEAERVRFVEVLRRAARKARAQASFPLALEYCCNALDLLGKQRWTTQFSLTRELQLDASDAALLVGDVAALYPLLDEAAENLREPRTARESPTSGSRGESHRVISARRWTSGCWRLTSSAKGCRLTPASRAWATRWSG